MNKKIDERFLKDVELVIKETQSTDSNSFILFINHILLINN